MPDEVVVGGGVECVVVGGGVECVVVGGGDVECVVVGGGVECVVVGGGAGGGEADWVVAGNDEGAAGVVARFRFAFRAA